MKSILSIFGCGSWFLLGSEDRLISYNVHVYINIYIYIYLNIIYIYIYI